MLYVPGGACRRGCFKGKNRKKKILKSCFCKQSASERLLGHGLNLALPQLEHLGTCRDRDCACRLPAAGVPGHSQDEPQAAAPLSALLLPSPA